MFAWDPAAGLAAVDAPVAALVALGAGDPDARLAELRRTALARAAAGRSPIRITRLPGRRAQPHALPARPTSRPRSSGPPDAAAPASLASGAPPTRRPDALRLLAAAPRPRHPDADDPRRPGRGERGRGARGGHPVDAPRRRRVRGGRAVDPRPGADHRRPRPGAAARSSRRRGTRRSARATRTTSSRPRRSRTPPRPRAWPPARAARPRRSTGVRATGRWTRPRTSSRGRTRRPAPRSTSRSRRWTSSSAASAPRYGLCRPPGHHAARAMYGGFCYFNNAAIAAEAVGRETGEHVSILDVDFHHGNGTEQIFWRRGDVLYVSLHATRTGSIRTSSAGRTRPGEGRGRGREPQHPAARRRRPTRSTSTALDRGLARIADEPGDVVVVSLGLRHLRQGPDRGLRAHDARLPRVRAAGRPRSASGS